MGYLIKGLYDINSCSVTTKRNNKVVGASLSISRAQKYRNGHSVQKVKNEQSYLYLVSDHACFVWFALRSENVKINNVKQLREY